MHRWVICAVLSLVMLEGAGNSPVVRANDERPQQAEKTASSGNGGGKHPAGDSSKGEGLYNSSCIVCHGPQAAGGIGPRLAGNAVLSNEPAFWKVVYEGRHVMPPLKGAITEQQMADIHAWLKTLR